MAESGKKRCRAIAEALDFYGVEPRIGAEVGVYRGELSEELLKRWPALSLLLVDWWRAAPEDSAYRASGDKIAFLAQDEMDRIKQETLAAVAFAGPRAIVCEAESGEVAKAVGDGSLDFVFIDGDHTFEAVRRDLKLWVPKVRPGGVVGGHDWYENRPGAERFAEEWKENALERYAALGKAPFLDNVPIQALAVGPLRLLALPGEVFCGIGIKLARKLAPFVPVGYANGCVGYIPTRTAFRDRSDYACYCAPMIYQGFPFTPEVEGILLLESHKIGMSLFPGAVGRPGGKNRSR